MCVRVVQDVVTITCVKIVIGVSLSLAFFPEKRKVGVTCILAQLFLYSSLLYKIDFPYPSYIAWNFSKLACVLKI